MNREQIFIFTGPTLSLEEARQHLDASYLPPVKYGDIYRITELYQPKIIGIIDGYFNQVPAVWHKEILWAIDQDILVCGAASMGALRAAELRQFGMTGCGKVFEAYRKGILPPFNDEPFEDDDEVAVVHSPAELGYLAASDAMVNIRFSFAKAAAQKVINQDTCLQLTQLAKVLFYADRQYASILEKAAQQGFDQTGLNTLADWLKNNAVDQKQLDAIELLKTINADSKKHAAHQGHLKQSFQHTAQWQTAMDEIDQSHAIENPALDELRLQGPAYFKMLDAALAFSLSNPQKLPSKENHDFSRLHRSPDTLSRTFSEHWQQRAGQITAAALSNTQCSQILLGYLHQSDQLTALEARAKDKNEALKQLAKKPTLESLNEIDKLQLSDWHFNQQLGYEMPEQLENYAHELGFNDMDAFYAMILAEYLYQDTTPIDGKRSSA